jgi:RNA polymerase sigma-70 factor, ECF subfamily
VAAVPDEAVNPADAGGAASADDRMQRLHELFSGPLLRFLSRLTMGDQSLAEDLVQETFLRAWRHLDALPTEPERAGRWLYTVARNVAIDAGRARKARPPEIALPDFARLASSEGDAMDRVVNVEAVRRELLQLSPDHRAVLIELYFRGASTAEAASRLGIPEGTVKSRAFYAVRSMHAALKPGEGLT